MTSLLKNAYIAGLKQGHDEVMNGTTVAELLSKWQDSVAMTYDELIILSKGLEFICDFMTKSHQFIIGLYYFDTHKSVQLAIRLIEDANNG